jgi:hypothetical protein
MIKPKRTCWSVIPLLLTYSSSLAGSEPLYAATDREFHEEHWVWSPHFFSVQQLTRFAAAFRSRASRPVNRALIFSSKAEAHSVAVGKGMSDYPYDLWRRRLEYALQIRGPLAELLVTDRGGLLRFRPAAVDKITRTVLWGSDPLQLEPNPSVDILWVTFPDRRRMGRHVQIYTRLEQDESEAALRSITAGVAKLIGVQEVLVTYRRDSWFIYSEAFPFFYPFIGVLTVPSEAAIIQSPTILCNFGSKGTACWETNRTIRGIPTR